MHIYTNHMTFDIVAVGYNINQNFYLPAEVSIASSVTGNQEGTDWPHQQPAVCAPKPGGKHTVFHVIIGMIRHSIH